MKCVMNIYAVWKFWKLNNYPKRTPVDKGDWQDALYTKGVSCFSLSETAKIEISEHKKGLLSGVIPDDTEPESRLGCRCHVCTDSDAIIRGKMYNVGAHCENLEISQWMTGDRNETICVLSNNYNSRRFQGVQLHAVN